jgi:hypothetical protein
VATPVPPRGLTRTGVAQFWLDVELQKFNQAASGYVNRFEKRVVQGALRIAYTLEGMVKEDTPVLTGRARASWHVVPPGRPDTFTYRDRRGKTFNGSLGVMSKYVLFGSNVKYMPRLEAGYSKQAPQGMLRINVKKVRYLLVAALKADVAADL